MAPAATSTARSLPASLRLCLAGALAGLSIGMAAIVLSACSSEQARRRMPAMASKGGAVSWSAPATLAGCSAFGGLAALFPQMTPFKRTGEGAIVFVGRRGCEQGDRSDRAMLAPIGSDDEPRSPRVPSQLDGGRLSLRAPLWSVATTKGQVALVGSGTESDGRSGVLLSEGPASASFAPSRRWQGAEGPVASAGAYLGDIAFAACGLAPGGGLQMVVQRHYQHSFGVPLTLLGRNSVTASCQALSLALDYRCDALAVWWHGGWLYARERQASGRLGPLQRFAKAGSAVQLTTVISDDGRAIVAWLDPARLSARLYLDVSGPGMALGPGRLVERLSWRTGALADGAVRLARLSGEGVLMAWTGTEVRRFVVRSARVGLDGLHDRRTISVAGEDAMLRELVTGPRNDALALWSRGRSTAVGADWISPGLGGGSRAGQRARLASVGEAGALAAAIDPASDVAIVVWREPNGAVRYVVGRSAGRGATRATGAS
jgi:hypothetical protein